MKNREGRSSSITTRDDDSLSIDLDDDEADDSVSELFLGVEVTQRRRRRSVPPTQAERRNGSMHQAGDERVSRKNIPRLIQSACDDHFHSSSTPTDMRPALRFGRT